MINTGSRTLNAEQVTVIVNEGQASRILKYAKSHGVKGGTILRGMGTINNKFLEYIGLGEAHRELVYFVAPADVAERLLDEIYVSFHMEKPHHGIAYTTPVCNIVGSRNIVCEVLEDEGESERLKYHVITVIVDDGKSEEVVEAARKAGARGGTILQGRGSGVHEQARVFAMDIEPEKEVVLIVSRAEETDPIIERIVADLGMDEPGHGFLFVQNAIRTYGLFGHENDAAGQA